ncbi:MmpS family protein [Yinghuangia sp. ASG 101]|uniref:MmpS family transport accessory protein n=1 Tax=Yinghuangia sp. ASG 101 TaxID=2896848 RepID=UPI001E3EC693|nr:MmpS family transport accessory protein [Yinghuangia sp. ASG 101]UGQ13461.1 MmpS family protein [Yinghuangia sp. ASG 101]
MRTFTAAAALLVATTLVTGCSDDGDAKSSKHTVLYEVVGTGPVDVTYSVDDPNSEGEEAKDAQLPWSHTIEVTTPDTRMHMLMYASASVSPDDTITCRLSVDGKVVSEQTGKRGESARIDACVADFSEPDFIDRS